MILFFVYTVALFVINQSCVLPSCDLQHVVCWCKFHAVDAG